MTHKLIKTDNYLLVVDDSDMVGNGYRLDIERMSIGIIDDDYFYNTRKHIFKKVIAHLPINDSRILEGVDLLPPIDDGIESLAKEWYDTEVFSSSHIADINSFKEGYNKAREKFRFTKQDISNAVVRIYDVFMDDTLEAKMLRLKGVSWHIQNILESLHQYPTEFECEMIPCNPIKYTTEDHLDVEPKTITTAQGVQWVGKYK